jgi:8-oxo-dGTP pyrophosphatase MutT (NUDIX family)
MPSEPNPQGDPGIGRPPADEAGQPRAAEAGRPPASDASLPHAAVAIIRTAGDDPHYLVLRRATNPRDPWSGHFALPGGRRDLGDRDLLDTVIRETLEETGLRLAAEQLISALPWARAGGKEHDTLVAPFLFEIPRLPELTLDAAEIAESHWLPLRYLSDPANHELAAMLPRFPEMRFPCIKVGDGAIWGFTYGVLKALLAAPGKPEP